MPLILALILLLGGGTTSVLANNSLPGDVLYPVKIHLNENVESLLSVTAKGDAEVSAKQAERRLKEAETLASQGKLNEKLNDEIKNSFSKEVDTLNKHIDELEKNGATTTASKIHDEFKKEIDGHYKSFLVLSGTSTTTGSVASSSPLYDLFYIVKKEKESDDEHKNGDEQKIERRKSSEDRKEIRNERKDDSEEGDNEDENEGEDDGRIIVPNPGPVSTSTTSTTTPPVTVKSYTMAEVAQHKTVSDCYTVVNGSVYNLTSFANGHPGGKGAIAGMCGVDASSAFTNQHGGQGRPEQELASLKIGVLAK